MNLHNFELTETNQITEPGKKVVSEVELASYIKFYEDRFVNKGYMSFVFDQKQGVNQQSVFFRLFTRYCASYFANCFIDKKTGRQTKAKGLFISSNPGTGKTFGFKIMTELFACRYLPARQIVFKCNTYHDDWQEMYREVLYDCKFAKQADHHKPNDILLDDLGSEEKFNNYGQKIELLSQWLSDRYIIFKK